MAKLKATITNAAYILVGLLLPIEIGVYCIALGVLSGIHHWFIDTEHKDFTVILDYVGMYLVGFAIILQAVGWALWITIPFSLFVGLLWGASRGAIGAIIGGALVAVGFHHIEAMPKLIALLGIAYGFNYIGDEVHRTHHDLIHSIWHLVTAYTIHEAILILL